MGLEKRQDESNFEFQKRLVYGKLVDKTLSDVDYTELSEALYGQPYASDVARRMIYGSRKTLDAIGEDIVENLTPDVFTSEIDDKMFELKKERQKLSDQRTAFNKLIRDRSRQEELNDIITDAVERGGLPALVYHKRVCYATDNDLLVSLNDIHYGAEINNYWNSYSSSICKTMMEQYLDRIISIGKTHDSQRCIVWCNGDEISGNIHQSIALSNKENVIEQVIGVSELIATFLSELSNYFEEVLFVSVAGNHSRIEPSKDKALVGERLDDLVDWYLKARLQNFENIVIGAGDKIDNTMYLIDIRGKLYCGVHGDFDCSDSKVQTLQTMAQHPLYAVLSGHFHHNKIDEVQGIVTVMAGSFIGMDSYCVEKRIYGRPEQIVCVCDKDGIRCSYSVPLRE